MFACVWSAAELAQQVNSNKRAVEACCEIIDKSWPGVKMVCQSYAAIKDDRPVIFHFYS